MKTKLLLAAIVLLLVANMVSYHKVKQYEYYYKSAEELLDTLESEYGWVDAIDNWKYYNAASKLRKN